MNRQDVLEHIAQVLADARADAAAAVDRAEAARDLRSLLYELAARHQLFGMTAEQMFDLPANEEEGARLRALVARALPGTASNH